MELFLPGFFAALVLVGIHAYLGLHVLSRGIIFIDLAMAQAAALGYAFAQLSGLPSDSFGTYVLALLFTLLSAAFFSAVRVSKPEVPEEAIIGLTFAVLSAGGIALLHQAPHGAEHIQQILGGQVLFVSWNKLIFTALLYGTIGIVHFIWRDKFFLLSKDPELARERGFSPVVWDFIFYATFGVVITSSVSMAGVLLVFTLLVGPAIFSFSLTKSFKHRLIIAYTFGFIVTIGGFSLSLLADLPTGATVVLCFGGILLAFGTYRFIRKGENRLRRLGFAVLLLASVTAAIFALKYWNIGGNKSERTKNVSEFIPKKSEKMSKNTLSEGEGVREKSQSSPNSRREPAKKTGDDELKSLRKAFEQLEIKGREE